MFVRDIRYYAKNNESTTFWQLMQRANVRREIAIGYKKPAPIGVVLNPEKDEEIEWHDGDELIVIAED